MKTLSEIQDAISIYLSELYKTNTVPGILFTADGSVVLIHYTGEMEILKTEKEEK